MKYSQFLTLCKSKRITWKKPKDYDSDSPTWIVQFYGFPVGKVHRGWFRLGGTQWYHDRHWTGGIGNREEATFDLLKQLTLY